MSAPRARVFLGLLAGTVLCAMLAAAPSVRAAPEPAPVHVGQRLAEALEALRARGLDILYSSDLVRPGMLVTAEPPAGSDLPETLAFLLASHGLETLRGPGGMLLVVRQTPRGEIRGVVTDHLTGRPVAGVRLVVSGCGVEATSDRRGTFRLEGVPTGVHGLEAMLAPYVPLVLDRVSVTAGRTTRVRLELAIPPDLVENVLVGANDDWPPRHGAAPTDTLTRQEVLDTPRVAEDVMRVLEPLPGLVGSDESAALNLRGGDENETLVLLDGLELYDPYHLKDYGKFMSIIDARSVGSVGVHTGAFAAEYGGRMSGVVDVGTVEPPEELRTTVSLSNNDAHALTGGSFLDGRGEWLLSTRRGFPGESEVLELHAIDSSFDTSYFDVFAKATYSLGPKSGLAVRFLRTNDRVEGPILDAARGGDSFIANSTDRYGWVSLNHVWSPGLLSQTTFSFADLDRGRDGAEEGAVVHDRRTTRLHGLKQDWAFGRGRHLLKWGLDFKQLRAYYDYRLESTQPSMVGAITDTLSSRLSPSGSQIGLFVSERIGVTSDLDLELGLRWDRQSYVPGGDDSVSPRLNLTYSPGDRDSIRLGWGYYYQPQQIGQLPVEDGIEQFLPAQRAQQASLSYEHRFARRVRFRLSTYAQESSRLHPRFENLFNPLKAIPEAASDRVRIDPDRGRIHGAELLVRFAPPSGFGWWLGYSLASAKDVVGGLEVRRSWDQRHSAGLGLTYRSRSWFGALTTRYHSGRPTTPVTAQEMTAPDGTPVFVPVIGDLNSAQLPDHTRLDLRVSRTLRMRGTMLELYVNATNLTNVANVCCIESFDFVEQPNGQVDVIPQEIAPQSREFVSGLRWTF